MVRGPISTPGRITEREPMCECGWITTRPIRPASRNSSNCPSWARIRQSPPNPHQSPMLIRKQWLVSIVVDEGRFTPWPMCIPCARSRAQRRSSAAASSSRLDARGKIEHPAGQAHEAPPVPWSSRSTPETYSGRQPVVVGTAEPPDREGVLRLVPAVPRHPRIPACRPRRPEAPVRSRSRFPAGRSLPAARSGSRTPAPAVRASRAQPLPRSGQLLPTLRVSHPGQDRVCHRVRPEA